jgi:hypothetical protein
MRKRMAYSTKTTTIDLKIASIMKVVMMTMTMMINMRVITVSSTRRRRRKESRKTRRIC